MVKIVASSETRLMVNHERRYALDYVHAREVVRAERYGSLRSIHCVVFMNGKRAPGETLLHDGTHMIDALRFLTEGEIEKIDARGRPGLPATALAVSFLSGGVPVSMEVGGGRDHLVFELDLSFERGRIRLGNALYEEYESDKSPFYEGMKSLKRVDVSFPRTEYFKRMIEDAVRVVDSGCEPVSRGEDALAVMETIATIMRRAKAW
jgi:predicted dehydrogenase